MSSSASGYTEFNSKSDLSWVVRTLSVSVGPMTITATLGSSLGSEVFASGSFTAHASDFFLFARAH